MVKGAGYANVRTGLIPRIRALCAVIGIPIEDVTDVRSMPFEGLVPPMKEISLRDYQAKSVKEVLQYDMGVLCGATGSGKTHMAAAIIANKKVRTLFLTHTKDLLYQSKKKLEELLGIKIGIIGGGDHDLKPITVATIQTMYRSIEAGNFDDIKNSFDMIIQDETHHIPASTFYEVTQFFNCRFIYGLSATPYRLDGADMLIEAAAGPIVSRISASDLIAAGILSKPVIRFVPMKGETSYSSAPRWAIIKKYIVENEARNRLIAELAKEFVAQNKTVLINVNQIKHGENIQKFIPEAKMLNGQNDSNTRKNLLEELRNGTIKVLISTILKEGVDLPALDCVVNAAAGTDSMQLVGRVLRKTEEKSVATVIDIMDSQHITLLRAAQSRMKKLKAEREFVVIVG
jgi:superfamily II DNA or RNA helicase